MNDQELCHCGCGAPLTGKQEKWASTHCRVKAFYARQADYLLSTLPEEEFRRAIEEACEKRHPGKYDRLRIRFGKVGDPPIRPGRYQG